MRLLVNVFDITESEQAKENLLKLQQSEQKFILSRNDYVLGRAIESYMTEAFMVRCVFSLNGKIFVVSDNTILLSMVEKRLNLFVDSMWNSLEHRLFVQDSLNIIDNNESKEEISSELKKLLNEKQVLQNAIADCSNKNCEIEFRETYIMESIDEVKEFLINQQHILADKLYDSFDNEHFKLEYNKLDDVTKFGLLYINQIKPLLVDDYLLEDSQAFKSLK